MSSQVHVGFKFSFNPFPDPPFFVKKPESKSAVAGDDVLIECRASGDPHPDIVWTKSEGDIDISKAKIVHGKGLRIESVHPSDQGTYVCSAKNLVGKVTAKAVLTVLEKPVVSVQPPSSVQARTGERVQLDCLVTGVPKPVSFWAKEGGAIEEVLFPGEASGGLSVNHDGSLVIEHTTLENSGHYTCTVVNEVGSTMARSHLVVYDPSDFKYGGVNSLDTDLGSLDNLDLSEARLATQADGVRITSAIPTSPTSLKVSWEFYASHKYLQGYHIWYKRSDAPSASFMSIPVLHSEATSFVFNRLQEHTQYDVFVQPFYKSVLGLPAPISKVLTHQDEPSAAPVIESAILLNKTALFLSWTDLPSEHLNGPLTSYKISIFNGRNLSQQHTIPAVQGVTQVNLKVSELASEAPSYTLAMAAENKVGKGPDSVAVRVKVISQASTVFDNLNEEESAKITWIIAVVSAMTFVLLIISVVFLCKRWKSKKPSGAGYLPPGTCNDFSHMQLAGNGQPKPIIKRMGSTDAVSPNQNNLWIEKGFVEYEKELSDSSERKLLNCQSTTSSHSNSDTEYAYVDRHNLSSFTNNSSGARSRNGQGSGGQNGGAESPEPYATTDIFKNTQDVYNQNTHYAAPLLPVYLAGHGQQRVDGPKSEAIRSCDDLCSNAQVYYHGGVGRNTAKNGSKRSSKNATGTPCGFGRKVVDMPPRNLLDMIPPPPNHPPPPPTAAYGMSQESVISPKYLFQHPYNQGPPYQQSTSGSKYKVRPSGHYEEPSQCVREQLYALPPSFHQRQASHPSQVPKMSPGLELQDELESFHQAVTQFNTGSSRASGSRSQAPSRNQLPAGRASLNGSNKSSSFDDDRDLESSPDSK